MSAKVMESIKEAKAELWKQLTEVRASLAALERVEADLGKPVRRSVRKSAPRAGRKISAKGKAAISRAAKRRWAAFRAAKAAKAKGKAARKRA